MTANVYEGMFILDPNQYARDPAGVSGVINELIEKHGGELLVSRLWSEQKLAYPLNGQRKGTYWLTYFRLESTRLADLNREVRINERVLRSLLLKIDNRLVDAMVAHALGQGQKKPEGEGGEKPAEAAAT
jgi:small subunit ribosomal protein S6